MMDDLTDEQKIEFNKKILKFLRDAETRGVSPMRLLDEEHGDILARSEGWPCVLKQWTLFEDDSRVEDIQKHNAEGQSHIGMHGVTVYATRDLCTLVRFDDGIEVWCNTDDLLID